MNQHPDALALLARIESSAAFQPSARHRALLRHLVERTLAGDTAALKETVIAIEVFGRPAAGFDPRTDSIVRVEARRLRARLREFQSTEAPASPLRITLPVGSYVPLFTTPQAADDRSVSRHARDLVERGEYFLRQPLSQATLEQAVERFDAALRESPAYAPAYVGLARAWFNLASGWYHPPAVASEHAAEALRQALVLDESNAVAHALLGALQHQAEHDWPAAQRSFERAVALAPQMAFVHSAYGRHLLARGQLAESEGALLRARSLDPLYLNTRLHMVNLRIRQRRPDEARKEIAAAEDLAPQNMAIQGLRGLLALIDGDTTAAQGHYLRCCELAPGHAACLACLAASQGMAGNLDAADATMARIGDQVLSSYVRAIVATRCGRFDAALGLLARAADERDPYLIDLTGEPSFEALHGMPGWQALVTRLSPQLLG